MNKKNNITTFFSQVAFALVLISVFGCNKWLDVKPKTEVKEDELFKTESGFKDALSGLYVSLTSTETYGDYLTLSFLDVLAQRYYMQSNYANYQVSQYNYEDAGVRSKLKGIWLGMYNAIANANNIIKFSDQNKSVLSDVDYALIKGEALGLRGFLHFDLLRMFGPTYAESQKPSIPYANTIGLDVYEQLTVEQVVDKIVEDLKAAEQLLSVYPDIPDLEDDPPVNSLLGFRQNHFNYWAAKATLARVYLFKGDKPQALNYAQQVIGSGKFRFVLQTEIDGTGITVDRVFTKEHIFSLHDVKLTPKIETYFKGKSLTSLTHNLNVIDLVFEVASGGSSDYRRAYLWEMAGGLSNYYPSKMWQEESASQSVKQLIPVIRLPEMFYIAAECTNDVSAAVQLLNQVRANRGIAALPTTLTSEQVNQEIFKEYRKEFFCEGQLFYYYKRKSFQNIEGTDKTMTNAIYVLPMPDDEILFGNRK
ncbi:MAG TPA: RagB/SusD family nutrient uptake outer membrane protein [Parasegetibacter sp.]